MMSISYVGNPHGVLPAFELGKAAWQFLNGLAMYGYESKSW